MHDWNDRKNIVPKHREFVLAGHNRGIEYAMYSDTKKGFVTDYIHDNAITHWKYVDLPPVNTPTEDKEAQHRLNQAIANEDWTLLSSKKAEKEKIPTFKEYRYLAECCARLEVRIAQLEARKS